MVVKTFSAIKEYQPKFSLGHAPSLTSKLEKAIVGKAIGRTELSVFMFKRCTHHWKLKWAKNGRPCKSDMWTFGDYWLMIDWSIHDNQRTVKPRYAWIVRFNLLKRLLLPSSLIFRKYEQEKWIGLRLTN